MTKQSRKAVSPNSTPCLTPLTRVPSTANPVMSTSLAVAFLVRTVMSAPEARCVAASQL